MFRARAWSGLKGGVPLFGQAVGEQAFVPGRARLLVNTTGAPEPRRMAGRDIPAPDEVVPRSRGAAESGVGPQKRSGASKRRRCLTVCPGRKASRPAIRRGFSYFFTGPRAPLRSARGWEITPHRAAGLRRGSDAAQPSGVPQTALRICKGSDMGRNAGYPTVAPCVRQAPRRPRIRSNPVCRRLLPELPSGLVLPDGRRSSGRARRSGRSGSSGGGC